MATAHMTYIVQRHGIQGEGGERLQPGTQVDVSAWRPSAVRQFIRRGMLMPAKPEPAKARQTRRGASDAD